MCKVLLRGGLSAHSFCLVKFLYNIFQQPDSLAIWNVASFDLCHRRIFLLIFTDIERLFDAFRADAKFPMKGGFNSTKIRDRRRSISNLGTLLHHAMSNGL